MNSNYSPGPINVEACVFDDFRLTEHLPAEKAPAVIERDRQFMSARPGFNRKLLPLFIEKDGSRVYSGGRYLLDTWENGLAFADWCENEFEIDGVLILDRPDFAEVTTHIFRVIGAHDFKDIHRAQTAYRTEIWKSSDSSAEDKLVNLWPSLRDRAEEEGHSSIWLLHNAQSAEISIVTVVDRVDPQASQGLDYATLDALAEAKSYGDEWDWAEKTSSRCHWVYTIWFPNTGSSEDEPALWPNSPPLPAPAAILAGKSAA